MIFPRQSRHGILTCPPFFLKLSIWQIIYWIFSSVFLWTSKKSCPSVFDECCNISRVKIYRYIFNILYIYIGIQYKLFFIDVEFDEPRSTWIFTYCCASVFSKDVFETFGVFLTFDLVFGTVMVYNNLTLWAQKSSLKNYFSMLVFVG